MKAWIKWPRVIQDFWWSLWNSPCRHNDLILFLCSLKDTKLCQCMDELNPQTAPRFNSNWPWWHRRTRNLILRVGWPGKRKKEEGELKARRGYRIERVDSPHLSHFVPCNVCRCLCAKWPLACYIVCSKFVRPPHPSRLLIPIVYNSDTSYRWSSCDRQSTKNWYCIQKLGTYFG